MHGSGARAWRRALLPLIAPAALAGACLASVLALVDFGVPAMLQVPVYAVEIQA